MSDFENVRFAKTSDFQKRPISKNVAISEQHKNGLIALWSATNGRVSTF